MNKYLFTFSTERSPVISSEKLQQYFSNSLSKCKDELIICSGFITKVGLNWVLEKIKDKKLKCKVYCRWNNEDLIGGSSSLEAYKICKNQGWDFYILERLHAKFFLIDRKDLIVGSANLTGKGLSLIPMSNKEFGIAVEATDYDLDNIDLILNESVIVNDEIYNQYKKWYEKNKNFKPIKYPELPDELKNLVKINLKKIWVSELPWSTPQSLIKNLNSSDESIEHDRKMLNIDKKEDIKSAFEKSRIFQWFKRKLNENEDKTMFFGDLTEQIHNSLFDDPKPYRKEVKTLQVNLYEYLKYCKFEYLLIDRPEHSERIQFKL